MRLNIPSENLPDLTQGTWLQNESSGTIHQVIVDSRRYFNPSQTLFIALQGRNTNGEKFISELYNKGIRFFIVQEFESPERFPEASFLKVENSIEALQKLAAHHRSKFLFPVVAITGSNGKTIVKEWLYQVLKNEFNVVRSPKSYNSQIGVPLSVLEMTEKNDLAIFEAGISHPGEMEKLEKVIRPDVGVFTHLGTAHKENFPSLKGVYKEKSTLFKSAKTVVAPKEFVNVVETPLNNVIDWEKEGKRFSFQVKNELLLITFNNEELSFNIPFRDEASINNLCNVIFTALHFNIDRKELAKSISELEMPALRLEVLEGVRGCKIINDTYNNDFSGLEMALTFQQQQKGFDYCVLILSEMEELLTNGDTTNHLIQFLEQQHHLNEIILIGTVFSDIELHQPKTTHFDSVDEFLKNKPDFKNASILVKGARKHKLERISFVYTLFPHESVLNINLEAIKENYLYFKSKLLPEVKVMVMVKASAYGGGMKEIASFLKSLNIDYLGVAYTNEGVDLRNAGIELPIMVLNPSPREFSTLIEHQLEPALGSHRKLDEFIRSLIIQDKENYPIHLEVETGMNRLGVQNEELNEVLSLIQSQPEVALKSVFSHLAVAEDLEQIDFTLQQIDKFNLLSETVSETIAYPFMKHICNSMGVLNYPKAHFNMVRLGLGLYGYGHTSLQPAFSMFAVVSQIKTIQKGESVSYGRTFVAKEEMRLGIISVGYADGLNKALSNANWSFIVNGLKVPVVGQICMDMCMVNLNGVQVEEGDKVQVFGPGNSLEEMSKVLNTIPYEILTRISGRILRIYETQ